MTKPTKFHEPILNPITGHEDGLPNPRPRPEIWREMLASHQVDPKTHLFDIYFMMQKCMADLKPFVDADIACDLKAATKREKEIKKTPQRIAAFMW